MRNDKQEWTPMRVDEQDDILTAHVFGPKHSDGADFAAFITTTNKELARFIAKACNSHYAMYEALADALQSLKRLPDVDGAYRVTCIQQCEAALALARGDK